MERFFELIDAETQRDSHDARQYAWKRRAEQSDGKRLRANALEATFRKSIEQGGAVDVVMRKRTPPFEETRPFDVSFDAAPLCREESPSSFGATRQQEKRHRTSGAASSDARETRKQHFAPSFQKPDLIERATAAAGEGQADVFLHGPTLARIRAEVESFGRNDARPPR